MSEQRFYSVSEFAKKIGVSASTLRRWDKDGVLKAVRSPSNRRVYLQEQLDDYMSKLRNNGFNKEGV